MPIFVGGGVPVSASAINHNYLFSVVNSFSTAENFPRKSRIRYCSFDETRRIKILSTKNSIVISYKED